jgi:regulator of cell morphogenesis and NO signaling
MASSTLAETRVGKIVAQQPTVARIFEKHQIDYCCRGNTTLADACAQRKVDLDEIITAIEQIENGSQSATQTDWNEVTLTELADHIVETHHGFLTTELPRITGLTEKVNHAHGDRRPELAKVVSTFKLMREELESHMAKEEQILFPAIRLLESESSLPAFPFGSVANPISMMEHEHDDAGNALRRLRELTEDFTPPADACPTYRVMLESLENLEQDLHLHIHKENNILFPRAKELEATARVG